MHSFFVGFIGIVVVVVVNLHLRIIVRVLVTIICIDAVGIAIVSSEYRMNTFDFWHSVEVIFESSDLNVSSCSVFKQILEHLLG